MTKTEAAVRMDELKRISDDICDGQENGCRDCPLHRMAAGQENLCVYIEKALTRATHRAQEEQRAKTKEGRK